MDDNNLPPLPVPPSDEQPEDEQPTWEPVPPDQPSPSGQQPPWSQQPPPPWSQQPPSGQQPPWQQRPPSGQPPYGQPPSGQWGQQPPPGWVPSPDYDQRKAKTWDYYYPGQMQPGPYSGQPLRWHEVWLKALTPSVDAYRQILADPTWDVNRAYLWLVIGMVINAIMDAVLGGGNLRTTSNFANNNYSSTNYNPGSLICCLPIGIAIALIIYVVVLAITHALASAFGGHSEFNRLVYAFAAFTTPVMLLSWIPCVGILLVLYSAILMVVAVKAVYEIGWVGSAISGLWYIPAFFACILCAIFGLAGSMSS